MAISESEKTGKHYGSNISFQISNGYIQYLIQSIKPLNMEFNFDLILVCQMGILILTGFLQSKVLSFVLQVRDINEDFG